MGRHVAWATNPEASSGGDVPTDGGRRRRRRGRGRLRLLAGAAALLVAVAVAGILLTRDDDAPETDRPEATAPQAEDPIPRIDHPDDAAVRPAPGDVGLVDAAEVVRRAGLAEEGVEPYAEAWDEVLADADDALEREPAPQEPLDIPDTDGPFVEDGAAAYALALAAVGTGEDRYAEAGRAYLLAWASTNRTTENTCRDSGACQTSLVIGRVAPGYVFATDLLASTGVLGEADRAAIDGWLRDVLLPATSRRANNWGDAGTLADVAITDHLGDAEGLRRALGDWRTRMDLVEDDGHIPEEVRRGESGILYTQGALTYKVAVAVLAERRGVDLWDYEGARGGTLREAVDHLAAYWDRPQDWPWAEGIEEPPAVSPMWELVHAHWGVPEHERIAAGDRPLGDSGKSGVIYTTFTNGVAAG